eukprot:4240930-Amphidinium_carterae.2
MVIGCILGRIGLPIVATNGSFENILLELHVLESTLLRTSYTYKHTKSAYEKTCRPAEDQLCKYLLEYVLAQAGEEPMTR